MKLQIYASTESNRGRFLTCIDEREGDLESIISDLLNHFWEEESTGHPSMLVTDESGKLLASLTMVQALGPVCGIVEIYRVNGGTERKRVEYILDASGSYDRTEIGQRDR